MNRLHGKNPIRLYRTAEFQCPYLDGKAANNVVLDPHFRPDMTLYSGMLAQGYRRSGSLVYRPVCGDCQQCISIRLPVSEFTPNRAQRRCHKKNKDLTVRLRTDFDDHDVKELYSRYTRIRHHDTESMHNVEDTFENFIYCQWCRPLFAEFRLPSGRLVCVAVIDNVQDCWSAVYTFYDPAMLNRGLGTYAIIWQIYTLQQMNKPYLYLGYYIKECAKMSYKTQFRPYEYYDGMKWKLSTKT